MKTTHASIADALLHIKPSMEFHDDGIREQLFFLWIENAFLSVLTRATWNVVNEPEPGIAYSTWVLNDAMKRRAADHQGRVYVYHSNAISGLKYIVPIGRILMFGVKSIEGSNERITLPLKYWDKWHGNGRLIRAQLPKIAGGSTGVWVNVGEGF